MKKVANLIEVCYATDHVANVAQLVERIHGKDEIPSSILGIGSW